MNTVAIYLLDRGISTYRWLCPKHAEREQRLGWEVKERRKPPHKLECEECEYERKEQHA